MTSQPDRHWTLSSERLPPFGTTVVIHHIRGGISTGRLYRYSHATVWRDFRGAIPLPEVDAWLPIPPLPTTLREPPLAQCPRCGKWEETGHRVEA